MFKLDLKNIAFVASIVLLTGCTDDNSNNIVSKPSIDGGVYYPIVGEQTSVYKINPSLYGQKINHGRIPTANEIKAWDKDIMADGTGLPEGHGSVEEGEALYEAQCLVCHGDFGSGGAGYPSLSKGNAVELQKTLTNNRWKDAEADGPVRVFGSYWPQASTLYWYIRDAMPHTKSKTLTPNETYALVAYILNINEMNIDGVEVDDEYVLNKDKFLKIKMPNADGFVPKISGKDGLKNTREFYKHPKNFGGYKVEKSKRCMKDCQKPTVKIARIRNGGINDFHPPISIKKDLPVSNDTKSKKIDVKKAYADNCAMCHGTGVAPEPHDKAGWAKLLAKGMSKVYENGIKGTNTGMPALGGSSLNNDDFKKVVDYMVQFK